MTGFIIFLLLVLVIWAVRADKRRKKAAFQRILEEQTKYEQKKKQEEARKIAQSAAVQISQSLFNSMKLPQQSTQGNTEKNEFVIDVHSSYDLRNIHGSTTPTSPSSYDAYLDEYKLGKKFKDKMGLTSHEVGLVNKFSHFSNVFIAIEGCCVETIKLYLAAIKKINAKLKNSDKSIAKVAKLLQDETPRDKNYGGYYYNGYIEQRMEEDVYLTIFKRAENVVREAWGHKRKLTGDFPHQTHLSEMFNTNIGHCIDIALEELKSTINEPDRTTEEELNTQNVSRWKERLEILNTKFKISDRTLQDAAGYANAAHQLAALNKRNPQIENIYYESSRFMASFYPVESLKLYMYYLHYDLGSGKFDNKQFSKTIQKGLFKSNEQLHSFEKIVGDFIKSKNLDSALASVSDMFGPRRKRITLDHGLISEVKKQDKSTVELLNEYLSDEYENDLVSITMEEISQEEMRLDIRSKEENSVVNPYLGDISLNEMQLRVLEFFVQSEFNIDKSKLTSFCKEQGFFPGQLVDSINEAFYDSLDDLLIEEGDDFYTISLSYYQKIIK